MTQCPSGGASFTRKGRKLPEERRTKIGSDERANTSSDEALAAPKPKVANRGTSYAAAAGNSKVRRPVVDKVQSFLDNIRSDFMSQEEVDAKRADINMRKAEALAAFNRAIAKLEEEEDDLRRQVAADRQMYDALASLHELTQKVSGSAIGGKSTRGKPASASGNTGKRQDAPTSRAAATEVLGGSKTESGTDGNISDANETNDSDPRAHKDLFDEVEAIEVEVIETEVDTVQKEQEIPVTASGSELDREPVHRDSHESESMEALLHALPKGPSFGEANSTGSGSDTTSEEDQGDPIMDTEAEGGS
ncbi:uncharacterized protein [Watersipora subatra]|uniref:uncharacterized protein n=1 Tax=Watersipora subatra TaxID=2589382 RepID=UPI00355C4962